jgi:hypothetical protein
MRLKNAHKNVHDALFYVHGSGGSRFLLIIIDWGIEILTTLNLFLIIKFFANQTAHKR